MLSKIRKKAGLTSSGSGHQRRLSSSLAPKRSDSENVVGSRASISEADEFSVRQVRFCTKKFQLIHNFGSFDISKFKKPKELERINSLVKTRKILCEFLWFFWNFVISPQKLKAKNEITFTRLILRGKNTHLDISRCDIISWHRVEIS